MTKLSFAELQDRSKSIATTELLNAISGGTNNDGEDNPSYTMAIEKIEIAIEKLEVVL